MFILDMKLIASNILKNSCGYKLLRPQLFLSYKIPLYIDKRGYNVLEMLF